MALLLGLQLGVHFLRDADSICAFSPNVHLVRAVVGMRAISFDHDGVLQCVQLLRANRGALSVCDPRTTIMKDLGKAARGAHSALTRHRRITDVALAATVSTDVEVVVNAVGAPLHQPQFRRGTPAFATVTIASDM